MQFPDYTTAGGNNMSDNDDYAMGEATGYGNNFWSHYGAMERAREERQEAERRARSACAARKTGR